MIAVLGPTASGKSAVAMELAVEFGAEIISVDSMQAYRGMDIGTAKPSAADRRRVRHHLIDIADPAIDLTVSEFQRLGRMVLDHAERPELVIAGGSGLHFRALVDPLEFPPHEASTRAEIDALTDDEARTELLRVDPAASEAVDLRNPRRVQRALEIYQLTNLTPSHRAATQSAAAVRAYRARTAFVAVGIDPGPLLERRVRHRLRSMVDAGLVEELRRIHPALGRNAAQAVGYKELIPFISGETTMDAAFEAAVSATMALAKRQRTFFRRDPRIHWLEWHDDASVLAQAAIHRIQEDDAWTS